MSYRVFEVFLSRVRVIFVTGQKEGLLSLCESFYALKDDGSRKEASLAVREAARKTRRLEKMRMCRAAGCCRWRSCRGC